METTFLNFHDKNLISFQLDSHKVSIFKWYSIISLINVLYNLTTANLFINYSVIVIILKVASILWLAYKIYVTYSIEVMFNEEMLPTVVHQQTQPFIDASKNAEENVVPPTYKDVMADKTTKSSNN